MKRYYNPFTASCFNLARDSIKLLIIMIKTAIVKRVNKWICKSLKKIQIVKAFRLETICFAGVTRTRSRNYSNY